LLSELAPQALTQQQDFGPRARTESRHGFEPVGHRGAYSRPLATLDRSIPVDAARHAGARNLTLI
jgi:hypothetical protein